MGNKTEKRTDFWKLHFDDFVKTLCKLQFANTKDDHAADVKLREKCRVELTKDVKKRNLKPFFEEYGKLFDKKNDHTEERMLVADFIKTIPMGPADIINLMKNMLKNMHKSPACILTPKVKEEIISELS